ncbi:MAG: flagellar biosynthetic protein FliR [Ignavibacteria bacterium]|nr:flagellar biosynthetic protein FliR [Ignavibacteria bacterium]
MELTEGIIGLFIEKWIIVLLVFARISGVFILSPLFRVQVIPIMLKVFIALMISIILTITLNIKVNLDFELITLAIVVSREILVGLVIGFVFNLVFWGLRFGGGIIDFELGFQAATLLAFQESSPSLFGQFLELVALMLFLFVNGHHQIFEALYLSYAKIPIGSGNLTLTTMSELGKFLTISTIIALKIAAPVIVSTFLVNVSLAMLARMAPQTNIFVVSFQIKIAVALLVFFLGISFFVFATKQFLEIFQKQTFNLILSIT